MESKQEFRHFNPFPGLRPFTPEESDLFFGREKESEEVLKKLLQNRFVTVIGASGTGKSSLIYCGVLPKVRINVESEKAGRWKIITFRPGNNPFGNLGDAISENFKDGNSKNISAETMLLDMHLNADGITSTIRKYCNKDCDYVLLVVDQFEELFRYGTMSAGGTKGAEAAEFVGKIVSAVSQPGSGIYMIITMRSDFIGECAHYQGLTQLINNSNYLVPHMDRENYRQAIEGPVKYAGASIEPKLVESILNDIGDRTDQLPVLQHALMRTWTHWQGLDETERPIGLTDYESVGRMSDAMSRHANEAYDELSPSGKVICEKMFKAITDKGTDNKGIRHPSSVTTLKSVIQCQSQELFEVVEKFRIQSRSFITPRQDFQLNDESIIDVSHESLMRLWDRLRIWVDEEAASVQMYLRLSEASAMYQQGKTSLWRPPDLQLAINWREQHKPTLAWAQRYDPAFERAMVYLRTSEKEFLEEEESKIRLQKKQIRRTKIVAMILGVAAMISVGFMLFAFVQRIAADREKVRAELNAAEAKRQEQFANIQSDSAKAAGQRAIENAAIARENEAEANRQRTNAVISQNIAERNEARAKEQEKIANEQSDSAMRARERAVQSAIIATQQKEEATRLRMLSIGKSMSIKSLQVQGQKELQTLLAYQAYLFYTRNNGPENDADIYAGLYNVAREYGNINYKTYKGHSGGVAVRGIAFVPGKSEFYTSGDDGRILKWNTTDREQTLQVVYSGTGTDITEVLAVSPDESWLACGSTNSSIRMIPVKGSNTQYVLSGHSQKIKSLIFSYDGKYLYSASLDGKVLKWDIAARTSTDVTTGTIQITSIDLSLNGNLLAGISSDGRVIVWDPESKKESFRIETAGKVVKVVRFKPDENILAIGDQAGNVELWDIATQKRISFIKAHAFAVTDIRFNPINKQMATAGTDNLLKIYNITEMADLTIPPITFYDDEGFVLVIQFSPDGQLIVSGAYEGSNNLIGRPSHTKNLVNDICTLLSRNMNQEEWNTYVAPDIPLEITCTDKDYNIKVNVKK